MDRGPFGPPAIAPYGTWASGIDANAVASGSVRYSSPSVDGEDIYWVERRPDEQGRHVLVRARPGDRPLDVTPRSANLRSRVHEYGQPAYIVNGGVVHYVELADQRLYRLTEEGQPQVVTPEGPWRYADFDRHPSEPLLACIREDHSRSAHEPVTTISVLNLNAPSAGDLVVSGHDFYAYPRFSPDGQRLLWLAWRHPQMPWDGTELWVADIVTGSGGMRLTNAQLVAGGDSESIFQPGWMSSDTIGFVSDRSGWWNLYRADRVRDRFQSGRQPLCGMSAEFGRPLWRVGETTWAVLDPGRLIVSFVERGRWRLGLMESSTGALEELPCGMSPAGTIAVSRHAAVFVGQSPLEPDGVVHLDVTTGEIEILNERRATLALRDLSTCEPIAFATGDEQTAHGFFYRPKNSRYEAPSDERPPLVVVSHGGPSGAASTAYDPEIQYWTSRGFAVVDVDYRGSTGYGRAYRAALNGRWGIVDVDDCASAARALAARGLADARRIIIRGASAGGYTTYAALIAYPAVFRAGASYFGVSDLEALLADTHKFEARYLDSLVGPYPERRDLYVERSPIHSVDRLECPLILFQGLEDRVVPPSQTAVMASALRQKGVPVAVLTFEGEPHGFRRAATIRRCLEAELYFYGVVLKFTPADDLEPVEIENV